jgi:hypothetical protein
MYNFIFCMTTFLTMIRNRVRIDIARADSDSNLKGNKHGFKTFVSFILMFKSQFPGLGFLCFIDKILIKGIQDTRIFESMLYRYLFCLFLQVELNNRLCASFNSS